MKSYHVIRKCCHGARRFQQCGVRRHVSGVLSPLQLVEETSNRITYVPVENVDVEVAVDVAQLTKLKMMLESGNLSDEMSQVLQQKVDIKLKESSIGIVSGATIDSFIIKNFIKQLDDYIIHEFAVPRDVAVALQLLTEDRINFEKLNINLHQPQVIKLQLLNRKDHASLWFRALLSKEYLKDYLEQIKMLKARTCRMKIEVPTKVPRRKLMDMCTTITKDLETRGVYCEVKDNSVSIAGLDREQVMRASHEIRNYFQEQLAESECSLHMTAAEQFMVETMSPLTELKEFTELQKAWESLDGNNMKLTLTGPKGCVEEGINKMRSYLESSYRAELVLPVTQYDFTPNDDRNLWTSIYKASGKLDTGINVMLPAEGFPSVVFHGTQDYINMQLLSLYESLEQVQPAWHKRIDKCVALRYPVGEHAQHNLKIIRSVARRFTGIDVKREDSGSSHVEIKLSGKLPLLREAYLQVRHEIRTVYHTSNDCDVYRLARYLILKGTISKDVYVTRVNDDDKTWKLNKNSMFLQGPPEKKQEAIRILDKFVDQGMSNFIWLAPDIKWMSKVIYDEMCSFLAADTRDEPALQDVTIFRNPLQIKSLSNSSQHHLFMSYVQENLVFPECTVPVNFPETNLCDSWVLLNATELIDEQGLRVILQLKDGVHSYIGDEISASVAASIFNNIQYSHRSLEINTNAMKTNKMAKQLHAIRLSGIKSHLKWISRGNKLIVEACGPPSEVDQIFSQIETADRETSVVVLDINSPTVYFDVRRALHEHGLAWQVARDGAGFNLYLIGTREEVQEKLTVLQPLLEPGPSTYTPSSNIVHRTIRLLSGRTIYVNALQRRLGLRVCDDPSEAESNIHHAIPGIQIKSTWHQDRPQLELTGPEDIVDLASSYLHDIVLSGICVREIGSLPKDVNVFRHSAAWDAIMDKFPNVHPDLDFDKQSILVIGEDADIVEAAANHIVELMKFYTHRVYLHLGQMEKKDPSKRRLAHCKEIMGIRKEMEDNRSELSINFFAKNDKNRILCLWGHRDNVNLYANKLKECCKHYSYVITDCEPDDWTRYNMMNMRKNGYFEIRWPRTVLSYQANILHINGPAPEVEEAHSFFKNMEDEDLRFSSKGEFETAFRNLKKIYPRLKFGITYHVKQVHGTVPSINIKGIKEEIAHLKEMMKRKQNCRLNIKTHGKIVGKVDLSKLLLVFGSKKNAKAFPNVDWITINDTVILDGEQADEFAEYLCALEWKTIEMPGGLDSRNVFFFQKTDGVYRDSRFIAKHLLDDTVYIDRWGDSKTSTDPGENFHHRDDLNMGNGRSVTLLCHPEKARAVEEALEELAPVFTHRTIDLDTRQWNILTTASVIHDTELSKLFYEVEWNRKEYTLNINGKEEDVERFEQGFREYCNSVTMNTIIIASITDNKQLLLDEMPKLRDEIKEKFPEVYWRFDRLDSYILFGRNADDVNKVEKLIRSTIRGYERSFVPNIKKVTLTENMVHDMFSDMSNG